MGLVGDVNHNHHGMRREKHAKKRREKALKVVYISSPMKVKTSASQFRALVQELTGRESDVARLMEINDDHGFKHVDDYYNHVPNDNKVPITAVLDRCDGDSTTSSDSLPFDDVFAPQIMDESFTGLMFPSGFLYESSQADFLRSLDAVL